MEESRVNNAEMRRRERAREGQRIFSAVGRPYVHPFHHKEVEEDFYQRAVRMVELYFDLSDPAAKKPVRLSDTCRMGKTAFWAFIYYFYIQKHVLSAERLCPLFPHLERPFLDENLDHFLQLLLQHVPQEAVGDRCAIVKLMQKYTFGFLLSSNREIEGQPASARKAMEKLRDQYRTVLRYFYTCLDVQL